MYVTELGVNTAPTEINCIVLAMPGQVVVRMVDSRKDGINGFKYELIIAEEVD